MIAQLSHWQQQSQAKTKRYLLLMIVCTLLCMGIAISLGAMQINIAASLSELEQAIIFNIRLPRALMTVASGAGLAICGVVLQSLTRNPLSDPGIIGVSSFAALFAAAAIFLSSLIVLPTWASFIFIPVMAFSGALLALLLLMLIAGYQHTLNTLVLILTGVALNAGAQTVLGFIVYLADDETLREITFWQLGSYSGITWLQALSITLVIGIAYAYFQAHAKSILLLQLGEQQAKFQGIAVDKLKPCLLLLVALVTALCVCFTGIVGFVGLVVPHIARMLVGANLVVLLPSSALLGACLVTLADTAARLLLAPSELPIGLLTSALGVPFFLSLILVEKRKSQFD